MTHMKCKYVLILPQPNVVQFLNVTFHQSEVLMDHLIILASSSEYIYSNVYSPVVVLAEGTCDDFLIVGVDS